MTDENTGGKDLRAQLEEALAKLNEATAQIDSYKATERVETIKTSLGAEGVTNLNLAKRFPEDVDPTDSAAVKQWIEDNKDDYNFAIVDPATKATTQDGKDNSSTDAAPAVTPAGSTQADIMASMQQTQKLQQKAQSKPILSDEVADRIKSFEGKTAYEIAQAANNFSDLQTSLK